ncbi:MAG: molybdenum cofactor guanylyltransferase [Caldilineaceae bacterium]|nr:molybdenum cofactor guanylyltransferase [Caldilineaceae bacterium]
MKNDVTLLINAGGESTRMGQSKALLPVLPMGTPLICYVAARLRPLAQRCIVVANDPALCDAVAPLGAICLPDAHPKAGPLGGLATGLRQIEGWAMCVACDMPMVDSAIFRFLVDLALEADVHGAPRWDAIVPQVNGRYQPLHALYHRRCLPAILSRLASGQRRMDCFLPDVRLRLVTESELIPFDATLVSFANINTPEEWERFVERRRDA